MSTSYLEKKKLEDQIGKMLASNADSPKGRRFIANIIRKYIDLNLDQSDVVGLILDKDTLKFGEVPTYTKREGIKAYIHEPGSYAPKSQITQSTVTAVTEMISANPEVLLDQLKSGRVGTVNFIKQKATAEIIGKINAITYNTIGAAVNNIDTPDNYTTVNTEIDKITLNDALSRIADVAGEVKAIIGRGPAVDPISDFDGFSDATQTQIDRKGQLGSYRGTRIVRLKQFVDVDGSPTIPEDEILVVGSGVGYGIYVGGLGSEDALDVNTLLWNIHLYKHFGCVVLEPERVYRIQIV